MWLGARDEKLVIDRGAGGNRSHGKSRIQVEGNEVCRLMKVKREEDRDVWDG